MYTDIIKSNRFTLYYMTTFLPCKAKRQYLLTLQVSRYFLLSFAERIYCPLSKQSIIIINGNIYKQIVLNMKLGRLVNKRTHIRTDENKAREYCLMATRTRCTPLYSWAPHYCCLYYTESSHLKSNILLRNTLFRNPNGIARCRESARESLCHIKNCSRECVNPLTFLGISMFWGVKCILYQQRF